MRALTKIAFGTAAATLAVSLFAGFGHGEEERKNTLPEKVAEVLAKAETWELISLDPRFKENGKLHGFDELGRTTVKDAETRKTLRAALEKGLAEESQPSKCFDPRHAIRATFDGRTVEVLICFSCHHVYIYEPGKANAIARLTTSASPQAAFDQVLKDAKVPLPEPAGK